MSKNLEYITYKQFIYTINIRNCYQSCKNKDIMDCYPIRLYYKEQWIDIGWYDYTTKRAVVETLSQFLTKEIMNSYVTDLRLDEEIEELIVYLEDKPIETLEKYTS